MPILAIVACAQSSGTDDTNCTSTIEQVQQSIPIAMEGRRCPDRWEDVAPGRCTYGTLHAGDCEGRLIYYGNCSMDSFVCEYDPTTHALVGASERSDTPTECRTAGTLATHGVPQCDLPQLVADRGANGDAGNDAGGDSAVGRACHATADCDPSPENLLVCSYTTPGCAASGVCVQQRMCVERHTYCGCDGQTFQTDVCYDGIPSPWVHEGACEPADASAADGGVDASGE